MLLVYQSTDIDKMTTRTRSQRKASTNDVSYYTIEGVQVPIDIDHINTLELEQCIRFVDFIIIRCNYIDDIKTRLSVTNDTYENEKNIIEPFIKVYKSRITSLRIKAKNDEKRRQEEEKEQKFKQYKAKYLKTGKCNCPFEFHKRDYPMDECLICGKEIKDNYNWY